MQAKPTALSFGEQGHVWLAFLVGASLMLSWGFACAVPFPAFATIAALTMTRRDALLAVALVWVANQVVGFGVLHYPWAPDTFAWGAALLAVALAATLAAEFCARKWRAPPRISVGLAAFASAFTVYEGLLLLVTLVSGAAHDAFAPQVVAAILALNLLAFIGLVAVSRVSLPDLSKARRLLRPAP